MKQLASITFFIFFFTGLSACTSSHPTSTDCFITQTIAIIGDFGLSGPAEAKVAELVKSWSPDLIISTGDNNYPLGEASTIDTNIGQYYADYIYPYLGSYPISPTQVPVNRFYPVLGNHDWDTDPTPYFNYFTLPNHERYYDLESYDFHFLFLNSNANEPDGITATSTQALWLQNKLLNSTKKFKFIILHHPPYTSSGSHSSNITLQWPFVTWGATAVIAGHNHFYERLNVEGLAYFVNGSGGKDLYSITSINPNSQIRFDSDYGAQKLTFNSCHQATLSFYSQAGTLIDSILFE